MSANDLQKKRVETHASRYTTPWSRAIFENLIVCRPRKDEVTREWRKLHDEELHNLYSSPNIIRMMKSRSMRWAGHVAQMGETRNAYRSMFLNRRAAAQ
jgi:adenine-specific DNA methylase